MELIYNYAGFLLKTITILISILIIISAIFSQKKKMPGEISADCLNENILNEKQKLIKKFKWKHIKKTKKINLTELPKIFILDFIGDIKASQAQQLREEITTILSVAQPQDEVMIRLESPGGAVNGYGFAASQIERLRKHNIYTTVCIDQVAASGGYLMACIANKIIAAPFAIIGSIGVIAQLPNLHKWLKKHDIDFEQVTAGKYKRTLTVFGENTPEGRKKLSEDLELIHENFKQQINHYRPQINLDTVATGEHWLARDAYPLGLIDELQTSDDWVLDKIHQYQLIHIQKTKAQTLVEKLLKSSTTKLNKLMNYNCAQ
jgi:serine protease SohB